MQEVIGSIPFSSTKTLLGRDGLYFYLSVVSMYF